MTLTIVGAGMAGLLAANLLRHRNPLVVEKSETLPNNHRAILRFSSPSVGDALKIPFRKVTLVKNALPWKNPLADILAYAEKTTGIASTDRSIARRKAEIGERWISSPDLIQRMASRVEVRLGASHEFSSGMPKVISTIPMPSLLSALGYGRTLDFKYRHGWVVNATVDDADAFATLLVPDPAIPFYRASITGDVMTIETLVQPRDAVALAEEAAELMGVRIHRDAVTVSRQLYAKILPVDEAERRAAIFWASSTTGIAYQLGRFATWRPGLLTEHLLHDIELIDGWIGSGEGDRYSMELHEAKQRRVV